MKSKKAIFDNMEVPGAPYMGRNPSDSNGAPENAEGTTPMRQNETRDWSLFWKKYDIDNMPISNKDLEVLMEEQKPKKEEITMSTEANKKIDLKKIAAKRDKRMSAIYELEDDYTAYGRYCGEKTCAGVWKILLGHDEKKKLGLEREDLTWKCPKCGKITSAIGSVSEQTSGFSAFNTYTKGPIADKDAFKPVNKISPDKDRTKR